MEELAAKTFCLLVVTLLWHWVKISRPYLVSVRNYWAWTKSTLRPFFCLNPYKIEVMVTSLTEMLESPNFGDMTTFIIWFDTGDKNTFIVRTPRVASFTDIKITTMFIETTFRDLKKLNELEIMYQNVTYICICWYNRSCWFLVRKF